MKELKEAGQACIVPAICSGVGLAIGAVFGLSSGLATGFIALWLLAIAGGAATKAEIDPDQQWLDNTPNRPRGISIAKNCRCEVCQAKRINL
jgi:hypothetical protein